MPIEAVLHGAVTQTLRKYVARQKATVLEWVETRPIFNVCAQDTGYEVGGRLWVPWWRQKAEEDLLRVNVEAISSVARVQRQQ